jgi:hypothetical protein
MRTRNALGNDESNASEDRGSYSATGQEKPGLEVAIIVVMMEEKRESMQCNAMMIMRCVKIRDINNWRGDRGRPTVVGAARGGSVDEW